MAELERTCSNCKYDMSVYSCSTKEKIMHCYRCFERDEGRSQFLSREADYPSLDCKDCRHSIKEYSEAPCSECVEHSNFEKRKKKKPSPTPSSSEEHTAEHTMNVCKGCAYDFRESVWKNGERDEKNKTMYCASCYRAGNETGSNREFRTETLDKRDCKNCKHYAEDIYSSGTACYECKRYSNYDEARPVPPRKRCKECLYEAFLAGREPCRSCDEYSSSFVSKAPSTFSSSESEVKPTPMFEDDISAEETQSVVKNVNDAMADLAFGMNPCTACEFLETDNEDSNCKGCCFNFPSKFKLRGAK